MVRAIVFSHHFPSTEAPSRAPYSVQTYRALARHCELRIVAPIPWWCRAKTPWRIALPLREKRAGIEAIFPSYYSIPRCWALHGAAVAASMAPYLWRLRRDFPFDILLAANAYPDAVGAAFLAPMLGVPLIVTVLGSDINGSTKHFALRSQIAFALRRASSVIAVSGALGDKVRALGIDSSRIFVIRNGVDGQRFAIRDALRARARLGLPEHGKIVVFVGNLLPVKGVDVLVEAARKLTAHEEAAATICIVGDGPMAESLKARAKAIGASERLHFTGRVLPEKVPEYMSAADVFCLPSRNEGCPNVILEALASGKPVVASRVGGIPELVSPDNGILVPPEDPQALALALIEAMKRPWNPEALRSTVPCLSWNDVGDAYAHLIARALSSRRVLNTVS